VVVSVLLVQEHQRVPCTLGTLLLGAGFLHFGVRFARSKSTSVARQLLMASIVYLPSQLLLMCLAA
jgi:heme O synthase-like polyprenyltransferase